METVTSFICGFFTKCLDGKQISSYIFYKAKEISENYLDY